MKTIAWAAGRGRGASRVWRASRVLRVLRVLRASSGARLVGSLGGLCLVLSSVAAMGCGRDDREPRAARAVLSAYDAFLQASPQDRDAAAQALAQTPCGSPLVCSDRDACARFATALQRAQELTRKARELGPERLGGNGAATKEQLAIIVGGADDATKEAETAESGCKSALGRLFERARR